MKMPAIKSCLLLAMTLLTGSAVAEIYKCVGPGGAAEYSDQPCRAGSSSEVLPDHSAVTQQQRDEAQHRAQQQERAADALENQREMAEQEQVQRAAVPVAPAPVEVVDEGATSGCSDPRRVNSNCARPPIYRPPVDRLPGGRVRPR
jgi:hypothetical protein